MYIRTARPGGGAKTFPTLKSSGRLSCDPPMVLLRAPGMPECYPFRFPGALAPLISSQPPDAHSPPRGYQE